MMIISCSPNTNVFVLLYEYGFMFTHLISMIKSKQLNIYLI